VGAISLDTPTCQSRSASLPMQGIRRCSQSHYVLQLQAQEAAARGAGKGGLDRASDSGLALLHLFAALGWEWGITALLLAGADCDVRDAWGRTPLHWAASRGHEVG